MPEWEKLTDFKYVGEKTARKLWVSGFVSKRQVCRMFPKLLAYVVGPHGYKIARNNHEVELEPEEKDFSERAKERIRVKRGKKKPINLTKRVFYE